MHAYASVIRHSLHHNGMDTTSVPSLYMYIRVDDDDDEEVDDDDGDIVRMLAGCWVYTKCPLPALRLLRLCGAIAAIGDCDADDDDDDESIPLILDIIDDDTGGDHVESCTGFISRGGYDTDDDIPTGNDLLDIDVTLGDDHNGENDNDATDDDDVGGITYDDAGVADVDHDDVDGEIAATLGLIAMLVLLPPMGAGTESDDAERRTC